MSTSTISYDRDHPHKMQMVWDVWVESIDDDNLSDTTVKELCHLWFSGKGKLIIPQTEWSRIVVTYL